MPVCTSVSTSKPSSWVPKPPGNRATASDSFTNSSLRVKKYFRCISLVSPAMIELAVLLEGQQDVDADAVLAAGADVAGLHDAAGRPGDDHEAGLGDAPAELDGLLVGRVVRRQPGRAEHRHLAAMRDTGRRP